MPWIKFCAKLHWALIMDCPLVISKGRVHKCLKLSCGCFLFVWFNCILFPAQSLWSQWQLLLCSFHKFFLGAKIKIVTFLRYRDFKEKNTTLSPRKLILWLLWETGNCAPGTWRIPWSRPFCLPLDLQPFSSKTIPGLFPTLFKSAAISSSNFQNLLTVYYSSKSSLHYFQCPMNII